MNTTNDLVSVIMPVCNGGDLFQRALESVRTQDHPNFEIIVVDDGSTGGTGRTLKSFSKSWSGDMKVLTHPFKERRGIAASYRLGLEHARGKYIAFLEHDDFWLNNKISEQIKVFDAPAEVGVVFSDVYTLDEAGTVSPKPFKPLINRPPPDQPFDAFWRLVYGNCTLTFSNIMICRDQINISDIITEPEGFQDWMLLLLLSSRCKFYHCSRTKTFWQQRQDSYHAHLKLSPTYRSLRRLALKNAIRRILQERQSRVSSGLYTGYFSEAYWHLAIYLFSAAEATADFLRNRVPGKA